MATADNPFTAPTPRRRFGPMSWLVLVVAVMSALRVGYVLAGIPLGPADDRLLSIALGLAFLAYVVGDARRRGIVPCFDFGWLVAVFLPVSIAWYAVWSRGWRGLLLLAGLFGLCCVPEAVALIARVALTGELPLE